MVKMAPN